MDLILVKYLHVLSSTLLFGTGIGTAFYLFFVSWTRDARVVAPVARLVVAADWIFTATTIVFQPLSGFYLAHRMGLHWTTPWIFWSTVLFVIAALCWLPVVWLQIRMRDLARRAEAEGTPLPPEFRRCFVAWFVLGIPALFAFLAIFFLMVAKPAGG